MASCLLETCLYEVALPGQAHSAECYSEWLAERLYEATGNPDPLTTYHVAVPIRLSDRDHPPQPLIMQPWYNGFIGG